MIDLSTKWKYIQKTVFDQNELNLIDKISLMDNPWHPKNLTTLEDNTLKSIKTKIKKYFSKKMNNKCAYCNCDLIDRGIETDREHIIPKGFKSILTYQLFNLTIACKRCNMTYKGQSKEHLKPAIVDNIDNDLHLYDPDSYLIPHPNIETIFGTHLSHISLQMDDLKICVYIKRTVKGGFLYNIVQLNKIETQAYDISQGLKPDSPIDYIALLFSEND